MARYYSTRKVLNPIQIFTSLHEIKVINCPGFGGNYSIKQYVGVEKCFARKTVARRNHIGLALRAFLRLERYCFSEGISWLEAKTNIIRDAVRAYLAEPIYNLKPTA